MNTRPRLTIPTVAERCYGALLLLYPPDHRAEYGYWMAQAFRDLCRDAYRAHGLIGVLEVWLHTLVDTLQTAYQERSKTMLKTSTLRGGMITLLGGVLMLITSAAQSVILLPYWERWRYKAITEAVWWLLYPVLLCLIFTNWLLYRRYADRIGAWGRGLLSAAIALGVISFILLVALTVFKDPPGLWDIAFISFMLYFVTWLLFGIGNLRWKVLPRWNALPLLVGLPLLLATLLQQMVRYSVRGQRLEDTQQLIFVVGYMVMGAALFLLGMVLNAESRQQESVSQ